MQVPGEGGSCSALTSITCMDDLTVCATLIVSEERGLT